MRLLALAGLITCAVIVFVITGNYYGLAGPAERLVTQVMAYAVLGSWLLLAVVRPAWRPVTPLLRPILLACLAYGLASLASQRLRLSLEPTLGGLALALTFVFLTTLLARPWFRERIGSLIVTAVGIVAIDYLIQVALEWVAWWGVVGRLTLPPLRPSFLGLSFGSPNLVANFLLVMGPLALAIMARRTRHRWPVLGLGAMIAVAVLVTGSRGAYLGVGLAGVLVTILLVARTGARDLRRRAIASLRRRPILLVPIGLVGAGALALAPAVAYRFLAGGEDLRLDYWRAAWTIFTEHPILGGGPGTWVQLKVAANPPGVPNIIVSHAHNLYIQAMAELGLVGLLALAILGVAIGRRLLSALDRPGGTDLHALAVIAGLTTFAGQSLVDNLVNLPYVCLMVLLVMAWVDGGLGLLERPSDGGSSTLAASSPTIAEPVLRRRRWRPDRGALVPGGVLLAMALAFPVLVQVDRATRYAGAGDWAMLHESWEQALGRYDKALSIDPDFTIYQIGRASALARLGRTEDARTQLALAVRSDPVAINLISLAELDRAVGDLPAAVEHARAAAATGVGEPTVALNAALVAESAGNTAVELDQLAAAVVARPELARLSLLDDPARRVTKSAVIAAARERTSPWTAAVILAYAGDPGTALTELGKMPQSHGRDLAVATVTWLAGDPDGAVSRLRAMADRNPLDWEAAAWAARILYTTGDRAEGDRFARWASIVQADIAFGTIVQADVVPQTRAQSINPMAWHYPWAIYLRPISPFFFAPQLVLVGTP